jgi:hypothetical protein
MNKDVMYYSRENRYLIDSTEIRDNCQIQDEAKFMKDRLNYCMKACEQN